jgi:hypothetical protein
MVLFDSQWWIHKFEKPGIESDCPYKTKEEFLSHLEDIITRNADKFVVLACHHPFKSAGIHGGYFQLKQHIFPLTEMWPKLYIPLPGLGTIYPIARGVFGTPQDMKHPSYQNMIKDIQGVVKGHTNVVYVAGHEHNLQYIKDSSFNYIVSGSASKTTRVYKNKRTPFTAAENGFAVLEISKNRNVDISFITVNKDSISRAFKDHLLNFTTNSAVDTTKVVSIPVATKFRDSVIAAANSRFDTASKGQRFLLGENYRKEWATPVRVKVFDISKEKGGFKVLSLGGGKQTRSLRLQDKQGREWTLRTINKDPEKVIPENLRGSLAHDIVNDMISSAHPYAPLVIPSLSKPLGIVAPSPEYSLCLMIPFSGFIESCFRTPCVF